MNSESDLRTEMLATMNCVPSSQQKTLHMFSLSPKTPLQSLGVNDPTLEVRLREIRQGAQQHIANVTPSYSDLAGSLSLLWVDISKLQFRPCSPVASSWPEKRMGVSRRGGE